MSEPEWGEASASPLQWPAFRALTKHYRDWASDAGWLYAPVGPHQREPWQGDVVPRATLPFLNPEGETEIYEGPAMLLSHGCDCVPEQDAVAVLAPVYGFVQLRIPDAEQRRSFEDTLRANQIAALMYLPDTGSTGDRYVNFSEASSVPTALIQEWTRAASPMERTRFTAQGAYFFVLKLGYYFARAENAADFPRPGKIGSV